MDPVPSPPRTHHAYAGWALVLLLGAVVAALTLGPAGAQDEGLSDAAVFAETSYANNCSQCHGADGNGAPVRGTDRTAPALVGRDDVTAAYMDLVLRTGRMPPPGDPFDNRARQVFYSDAEREALVAWMTETFDLVDDIPEVGEGDVARGLEVFALNCAHCHGNTGAGGTAGRDAWTPEIQHLDGISIAEAIRVGPFDMPAFSADALSDEEVDAVVSFLAAVDEEGGTPVFGLVELNPVFASGFVGLLAVVMMGSLLYIAGRPLPFVPVQDDARPLHAADTPVGLTEDPGAPDPDRDDPGPLGEPDGQDEQEAQPTDDDEPDQHDAADDSDEERT